MADRIVEVLRQLLELETEASPTEVLQALFSTREDLREIREALEQPLFPLGDPEENFRERLEDNRFDKDAILMQALNAFARWRRIPYGPFEGEMGVRVFLWIYEEADDGTVHRPLSEDERIRLIETKLPREVLVRLGSAAEELFIDEDGNLRDFVWIPKSAWMNLCTLRGTRTTLRVSNEAPIRWGRATRDILLDGLPKDLGFVHPYKVKDIVALLTICPLGGIKPYRESFFDGITQGADVWVPVPWAPPEGILGIKREPGLNLFYDIFFQILEAVMDEDKDAGAACWEIKQTYMDYLRTIADTSTEQRLLAAARYQDPSAESFKAAPDFDFRAVHGDLMRKDVASAWDDGLWDHLEDRLPNGMPDDSARRERFARLWKAADQSELGMVHEEALRGMVTRWSDLEERLGHGWLSTEDDRVRLKNQVADTLVDRLGQPVYAKELAERHRDAPVDVVQGDPEDVFWKQFISGSINETALKAAVKALKGSPVHAVARGIHDFLDVSDQRFLGIELPATIPLVYGLIAGVITFNVTGGFLLLAIVVAVAVGVAANIYIRRGLGKRRSERARVITTVLLLLGVFLLVQLLCGALSTGIKFPILGGGNSTPVPDGGDTFSPF